MTANSATDSEDIVSGSIDVNQPSDNETLVAITTRTEDQPNRISTKTVMVSGIDSLTIYYLATADLDPSYFEMTTTYSYMPEQDRETDDSEVFSTPEPIEGNIMEGGAQDSEPIMFIVAITCGGVLCIVCVVTFVA